MFPGLYPGRSKDGSDDLVIVNLVMFDNHVLLNGSIVKEVISSIDEDDISEMIGSVYYSGELYSEPSTTQSVYVQLITGLAGGKLKKIVNSISLEYASSSAYWNSPPGFFCQTPKKLVQFRFPPVVTLYQIETMLTGPVRRTVWNC